MDDLDIQKSAKTVAKALNERNAHAISKIGKLIELLGMDFVQKNLEETLAIEAKDGMKTNNGKRRRTPGGVFFYLIRPKLSTEQQALIFPPIDWKKRRSKKKAKEKATKSEVQQVEATESDTTPQS